MDAASPSPRVLVIGLDPYRIPGPWDPRPVATSIEAGLAQFALHNVGVETCLLGLDGSDDVVTVVRDALRARPWECVVVGGGLRGNDTIELFERIINLIRVETPAAAIAFTTTPDGIFDAAARWITIDPASD